MSERFKARYGDLRWGPYDYPVTPTQHETATSLEGLIKREGQDFFCSQRPDNGTIIMGTNHRSVDIRRDGRVYSNGSEGL